MTWCMHWRSAGVSLLLLMALWLSACLPLTAQPVVDETPGALVATPTVMTTNTPRLRRLHSLYSAVDGPRRHCRLSRFHNQGNMSILAWVLPLLIRPPGLPSQARTPRH